MSRNGSAGSPPISYHRNAHGQWARPPGAPPKVKAPTQRSRVSNGRNLFLKGKGSPAEISGWHRRLKDLFDDHISDLGGADACSTAELSLCRRAANLELQLELIERFWSEKDGQASDRSLNCYVRAAGCLKRILEALGLQRRSKDVTPPSLEEYLRAKYPNDDAEEADGAEQ